MRLFGSAMTCVLRDTRGSERLVPAAPQGERAGSRGAGAWLCIPLQWVTCRGGHRSDSKPLLLVTVAFCSRPRTPVVSVGNSLRGRGFPSCCVCTEVVGRSVGWGSGLSATCGGETARDGHLATEGRCPREECPHTSPLQ